MHTINRRSLVKSLVISAPLFCQVAPVFAQLDKETLPFRSINIPSESKSVAIFFDFTCPFSAKYHPTLVRWISTVPKTVRVNQYPIVNVLDKVSLGDRLIAAKCFYAAAALANSNQLQTFVSIIYEARQQFSASVGATASAGSFNSQVSPLSSASAWIGAARKSGLNEQTFRKLVTARGTTTQAEQAARKLLEYKVLETPCVGIGGRYVLTPDSANGDTEMFFNLLNGLVSEII